MSNARKLADLLDSAGDIKSAHLDNVPASDDASALTTGTLPAARIAAGSIADAKLATGIDATKLTGTIASGRLSASNLGSGTIPAARLDTATTQAESNDSTKIATTAYVVDKITTLIGGAPSTLNDLNELAAAINDDANYNSTLTTALATKLPLAGGTMTGNIAHAGAFTIDAGNNIALDNGSGNTVLLHNGSQYGLLTATGSNLIIKSGATTALTFSNQHVTASGNLTVNGNILTSGTVDGVDIQTLNTTASAALPTAGGTMTGQLAITDGSLSAPAIANTGDLNTGMCFPADETIAFSAGGTQALKLYADKKVVAGEEGWDISTGLSVGGTDNANIMNIFTPLSSTSTWGGLGFGASNTSKAAIIYQRHSSYSVGSLSICVNADADLSHADLNDKVVNFSNNKTTEFYGKVHHAHTGTIMTGGNNNTTSENTHIEGYTGYGGYISLSAGDGGVSTCSRLKLGTPSAGQGTLAWDCKTNSGSLTERFFISQYGVTTFTSDGSAASILTAKASRNGADVCFNINNTYTATDSIDERSGIQFVLGNGLSGIYGYKVEDTLTGGKRDIGMQLWTQQNNSYQNRFQIDPAGNLTAQDTSIGSMSDERLKKDIADYNYSLTTFKALKPRIFNWKNPNEHGGETQRRGFVAQEIKVVDDYWISTNRAIPLVDQVLDKENYYIDGDVLPEGKNIGDVKTEATYDYQYVKGDGSDYDLLDDGSDLDKKQMIAKLGKKDAMYVSVIQQLITKIEALETKVTTLENA